jgi:hypothetical protein
MERKPDGGMAEALREVLLRLAVAHNRAVLAGAAAGVGLGLAMLAQPITLKGWARLLVLPHAGAGLILAWRAIRLHGRVVRDLGAGRAAAAAVAAALLARGGAAPLRDLEAAFPREELERAIEFLGRLRLAWAEPGRAFGVEDVLRLDGDRLRPFLDPSPPEG